MHIRKLPDLYCRGCSFWKDESNLKGNGLETRISALQIASQRPLSPDREQALREASLKLEASFLAEMLKSAGFDGASSSFGGGEGEEQFQSFLREAQAQRMAESGGVGLAENIFQSLKERGL